MEVMNSCRCCLRRLADKNLTTPYTHLGKTEIYADMLKECFAINLWVSCSIFSGICSECVGRLRDASEFKLQVQRSQVELLEQLQVSRLLKQESPSETEMADEEKSEDDLLSARKTEPAEPTESMEWAHSVRLERLRGDAAPRVRRVRCRTHKLHTHNNYQCDDCGKGFAKKKAIARHIRFNCLIGDLAACHKMNRKSKIYMNCSYCSFRSKNERNLYHHEMRHIGENPYKCKSCNYETRRKADFERHQSIHSGKKPFKCNFCDYTCIQKHTLLVHIRTHTGEKPYECSYCDSRFSREQVLRKHQKRRHRDAKILASTIREAI